jgi:hypothetical protein
MAGSSSQEHFHDVSIRALALFAAAVIFNQAGCTINAQGGSLVGRVIDRGTIYN